MAVRLETQVIQFIAFMIGISIWRRNFSRIAVNEIDHLVLENADQPGFKLRPVSE